MLRQQRFTLFPYTTLFRSSAARGAPTGAAFGLEDPTLYRANVESFRTATQDRKSTRLNSSHVEISYAVFCLKKKKTQHCPLYRLNLIARLVVLLALAVPLG